LCNLYSVTKGQQAIRELAGAMHDRTGNLPPLYGIFPDDDQLHLCGGPSFLENLFHAVIGDGRLELVCLQADGLLDCRIGGGKDQRPRPVRLGAPVVRVRQRHGQDFPLCRVPYPATRPVFRRLTWFASQGGLGRASAGILSVARSPLATSKRATITAGPTSQRHSGRKLGVLVKFGFHAMSNEPLCSGVVAYKQPWERSRAVLAIS
jgi:hypothetical protein